MVPSVRIFAKAAGDVGACGTPDHPGFVIVGMLAILSPFCTIMFSPAVGEYFCAILSSYFDFLYSSVEWENFDFLFFFRVAGGSKTGEGRGAPEGFGSSAAT